MNTLDRIVRMGLWLILPLLGAAVLPAQTVTQPLPPTASASPRITPQPLRPGPVLCYDDLVPPAVIAIDLTGKDEHDHVLYHRIAYVFYGPIRWTGVPRKLVAMDTISITRWLRPESDGRCNLAAPKFVETGFSPVFYCPNEHP